MDLHTRLTQTEVSEALERAQDAGRVANSVEFIAWGTGPSRTHERSITFQLGSLVKDSLLPGETDRRGKAMHVRRYKNGGTGGASPVWAATWRETGWFMAEVFARDPQAKFSYVYDGAEDFHRKTDGAFLPPRTDEEVLAVNREQLATRADGTWVNYLNP